MNIIEKNTSCPISERRVISFKGRKIGRPLSKNKKLLLANVLSKYSIKDDKKKLDSFFESFSNSYELEIGSGSGEFIINRAKLNPKVGYIAVEPYQNGLASLASKIEEYTIDNIRIFDDDAYKLFPSLPSKKFENIYTLFPDPWPKLKHQKRRIIQRETLDIFSKLLIKNGNFYFVSDHSEYCRYTLILFQKHSSFMWSARSMEDWQKKPKEWVSTRYEIKARKAGISPIFLNFINSKSL